MRREWEPEDLVGQLQRVTADQDIALTAEDLRAITPLFWAHVRPYGKFELHLDTHLDIEPKAA